MATFEFSLRATERDPEGYYHPRWDLAQHITVRAQTKQEAINKAAQMLGPTVRRSRWYWTFKVDSISEVEA